MKGQESTKTEIVNPVGKWYFGAEMGANTITSYSFGEPNKSFQGGILAEYYFGRHWSLTGRVKYFKTGFSFYKEGIQGKNGYFFNSPTILTTTGNFEGEIIILPINIKWEFRIYRNFSGNLNFGTTYSVENKGNYNYSQNISTKYAKEEWGFNMSYGCNYFISKKVGLYINFESYSGGDKGSGTKGITNTLLNFGFKYNFKKVK